MGWDKNFNIMILSRPRITIDDSIVARLAEQAALGDGPRGKTTDITSLKSLGLSVSPALNP